MILTVTPNPCVDKTVYLDKIELGTFMRAPRYSCVPGGKGSNVARAVQAMGGQARAFVVVGSHTGAHVVDMITNDDGVECVPFWVASPTRTITTVLEETIHRQTAFFEPGSAITDEEGAKLVQAFGEVMKDGVKVVTFNGTVSDKRIQWLYKKLIPIAKQAGAITILDTHGPELALGLEAIPYMVKPNVDETQRLLTTTLDTDDAKWEAVQAFHSKGVELVVLSLGKDGALVSRGDERFRLIPPEIREVNPVGSGDALVAGFAMGLLNGIPLEAMSRKACAMGAANATSWDIGHFSAEEVSKLEARIELVRVSA